SLLVRVRRHAAISVTYQDEHGGECIWSELEPAEAELVQHEIDHLDGTLAVDRAEAVSDIITRAAYAADPDRFNAQVDSAPTAIAARPDRPRNPSRTADPRRPD
ncbi:MAG: peptide deformylase, partial [Myxococcota bacterium]